MIGITEYIAEILNYDVNNVESNYTKELRTAATAANWPVIVTTQLEVVMVKGKLTVEYPDSIREEVELLEFGTQVTPPNPVIRNFIATLPKRERI